MNSCTCEITIMFNIFGSIASICSFYLRVTFVNDLLSKLDIKFVSSKLI